MTDDANLAALFVQVSDRVRSVRRGDLAVLDAASVTATQAILLDRVARGAASTPSTIAFSLGLSQPSATQMIDRLETAGYLRRTKSSVDRRSKTITVTAKTRALLKRLARARCNDAEAEMAALSPATRQALAHALSAALDELALR